MSSIRDSIDYIFDTLCVAGGGSKTRHKMKPAKPSSDEIECFKRLRFKAEDMFTLLNGNAFYHFQEHEEDAGGRITVIDYFAVKNIFPSEFNKEMFEEYFSVCDVTESFFVFLCPSLKLKIREDVLPQEISNNILFQQDDALYQGHYIPELIDYFEPLTIFRLDDLSADFNRSFLSSAYYLLSSCQDVITLPLASETIDKLRALFIKKVKIPKDNVFLSLTSSHLKHCFLELYRCIEWLYVIPRSRRLKGVIQYSRPAYELAVHCIDELSWRRKEEDSLSRIVTDVLQNYEDVSFKLVGCGLFNGVNIDSEGIAKHLYSFRNQFVHQFEARKEKDVLNEHLIEVIDLIADFIIHAYDLYDVDIIPWRDEQV
jgi:hypothetical protein